MKPQQRLAIIIALRLYRAGRIGGGEMYHRVACSCLAVSDFDKDKMK